MVDFLEIDEEILYTKNIITTVDDTDLAFLMEKAIKNKRRRVRLCTHPNIEHSLHEMLIIHCRDNYVPPHKHPGKSESFHIIEGSLDVVIFFDDGTIREIINMGEPHNGEKPFYYRISEVMFHTVLPTSEMVVFHETTNGPFRREEMVFAEWAPAEDAAHEHQLRYLKILKKQIRKMG